MKVPDYPDVALEDVQRSTVEWKEYYSGTGTGFDAPEIINNVEVLKRMTIEQKIDFWRKVMRYGKAAQRRLLRCHLEHFRLRDRRQIRHHRLRR